MKAIIATADDFGLALAVNEAVERAYREGILTCASLMVGGAAAEDAVERARRNPGLRVGLHLAVVEARPVLPPAEVPALVDRNGEFSTKLVRAGFRFFFLPQVRRQLEAEVRAQFEAFKKTGLPLDHVNAHNHMHLHPTLLGVILRIGQEYGLKAVRLPYEPPLASYRAAGKGFWGRLLGSLFLWPWTALVRLRLSRRGIACNDRVFGLHDSGRMDRNLVLRLLARLPGGVSEVYFHPATRRDPALDRHMAGYRHEEEFAALCDPEVRRALQEHRIGRISFSDLTSPTGRNPS